MYLAICDNDPHDLDALHSLAERYAARWSVEVEISAWTDTSACMESIKAREPDVLLLDLYWDEGQADGLDLARQLRAGGFDSPIIFVTSSREHFADGYAVGALHYLVKPVSMDDFAEGMRRVRLQIREAGQTLTVTSNWRKRTVSVDSILYLEVRAHQTQLVTRAGILPLSISLAEAVRLLGGDARFIKCFRSYVVNMNYITRVEKDYFVMDNGDRIPIARREAGAIKDKYMNYVFSSGKKGS